MNTERVQNADVNKLQHIIIINTVQLIAVMPFIIVHTASISTEDASGVATFGLNYVWMVKNDANNDSWRE